MYHRFELATARVMMLALFGLLLPTCNSARAEDKLDRLQGYWRLESARSALEDYLDENMGYFGIKGNELTFYFWIKVKGDELSFLKRSFEFEIPNLRIKLFPDEIPKQLEISFEGEVVRTIYELRDDELVVGFGRDPKVPPKDFSKEEDDVQIRLTRISPSYAERVERLQGAWKVLLKGPSDEHRTRLFIWGERILSDDPILADLASGGFRLSTDPKSPTLDLFAVRKRGRSRSVRKPAIWKQEGDQLKVCIPFVSEKRPTDFEPDVGELLVSLERFSKEEQEELARDKLKSATEASSLSEKKRILQYLAKMYAGTKAAEAAKEQLKRMPSDDEIRKIDEAAEAAQQAEILEAEAARFLRIAKLLKNRNPQAYRRRLKEIVDNYEGTEAAEEAKRLLDRP